MALPHAASGEVIPVHAAGGAGGGEFSSIALARTDEMELIRMLLPKGKTMPEHHVPGEITLLCLEGEVVVDLHGEQRVLLAGQMLYLNGGQAHGLEARQDSIVLLTILLAPTRLK